MAPRFSGIPFLQHPIPAAPRSCTMGCWLPRAMAGSGRRLNLAFPAARSDPRSIGGPGGKNRLVWFLPADRSRLETVPGEPGKSWPAAPPAATQRCWGVPVAAASYNTPI